MKKTPLKRKTPMKRVSDKMMVKSATYTKLRKQYLIDHPDCEICRVETPTQVHHRNGRGKFHNDTTTWMALCARCHENIHQHPNTARKLGHLK